MNLVSVEKYGEPKKNEFVSRIVIRIHCFNRLVGVMQLWSGEKISEIVIEKWYWP